ncbi:type-F conjugative transfer system pilin assembly protein TrbC, partial [Photobacterium phosphoreum]|uniref:type-F conjugative transfer system pilin assembly protein TrbC n=1 Tax=Photobacterium phosphoreum TaxID=659 RepID=UPI000D1690D8
KENNYVMGGVSIDPRAFKQFGITQVPAFVAVKKGHCINNQEMCDTNDFDVIYGSLSLNNALDILARKGRFGDEINKINALNKQENKRG